jgi:hypothetical protein
MTPTQNWIGLESMPRWLIAATGVNLVACLSALYLSHGTGLGLALEAPSDGTGTLSATGMAALELWLSMLVLRSFRAGAPLRPAWLLIALSAASRMASGVLAQVLGSRWLLNPLAWTGGSDPGRLEAIRHWALVLGGPVQMAFLSAGLFVALRTLRKFGFWVRPSATDWAVAGMAGLFMLCRLGETAAALLGGTPIQAGDLIALSGCPVLCVLFLEAMLLRQSVTRMGHGLVAKCWGAFAVAIFMTGFAEAAVWVIGHYSAEWPLAVVQCCGWFPGAAAFALAPAYQVAALCRATRPAAQQLSGFLDGGFPEPHFGAAPAAR